MLLLLLSNFFEEVFTKLMFVNICFSLEFIHTCAEQSEILQEIVVKSLYQKNFMPVLLSYQQDTSRYPS